MGLTEAIDELYTAFGDAPAPTEVDGCTHCCTTPEQLERLVTVDRRDLGAQEMRDFAFNAAGGTVGTDADLVYFLPRILEVMSSDIDGFEWTEVLMSKLPRLGIDGWSPERRGALSRLFVAMLDDIDDRCEGNEFDHWVCGHEVDTVVTAIAVSGLQVGPFLVEVERRPALLWRYHTSNSVMPGHPVRLANPWADAPHANANTTLLCDWLASERVAGFVNDFIDRMFFGD